MTKKKLGKSLFEIPPDFIYGFAMCVNTNFMHEFGI